MMCGGGKLVSIVTFCSVSMNSAVIGAQPWPPSVQTRFHVAAFSQFEGAQSIAAKWGFDRNTLDRFALESHRRAAAAIKANAFAREIVPVPVTLADGKELVHDRDRETL